MFSYPDDGYFEIFLRSDTAIRKARQILSRLERAEHTSEPAKRVAAE